MIDISEQVTISPPTFSSSYTYCVADSALYIPFAHTVTSVSCSDAIFTYSVMCGSTSITTSN
jgi:hypothetical protein